MTPAYDAGVMSRFFQLLRTLRLAKPLELSVRSETHVSAPDPALVIAVIRLAGRATRWHDEADDAAVAAAVGPIDGPVVVFDLRQLDFPIDVARRFRFALDRASAGHRRHVVIPPPWRYNAFDANRVTWLYEDLAAAIAAAEADELRRRRNATLHARLDLARVILRGGLGPVRFGMSRDEVRGLIGEPDNVGPAYHPPSDLWWDSEELDVTVTFRDIPGRGVCAIQFRSHDPSIRLLGVPINHQSFAATRAALERAGVPHQSSYHTKGCDWHGFDAGLLISSSDDFIDYVEWSALDDDEQWMIREPIG